MSAPSGPARWYLASVVSFMIPMGIQSVMLPYLLAIELRQGADRYGLTQMAGQLPMLALLVFGGWLADRADPRRLLIGLHLAGMATPLALAAALHAGVAGEGAVLLYALAWGVISAFALPARDGMLTRVAGGDVQRMVTLAMGAQFAMQIVGQALAGQAGRSGPIAILVVQAAALALGIWAVARLPRGAAVRAAGPRGGFLAELGAGFKRILGSTPMRATFLFTCGMGVFFVGVFVVLVPMALRDLYAGGAQDISVGYVVFGAGTLISIAAIMRAGGIGRPARGLGLVLYLGCAALLPIALAPPLWVFYLCIFVWGMGGGVAMTMSRTIMQEHAPPDYQSRVMAAFSLAVSGGAPLGSLLMGYAVSAVGVQGAVLVPVAGVALVTTAVLSTHPVWQLRSRGR